MAGSRSSSELLFRVVVLVIAGILALGMVTLRFGYQLTLPDKPPAPPPRQVQPATSDTPADPLTYARYLEQDSAAFQVSPATTAEQMAGVLTHRVDEARRVLDPAGSRTLRAAGLRLTASVRDIKGSPQKMMVLSIVNLTDRPLAYRVVTEPEAGSRGCRRKQHLDHNALALPPGGRIERSECLYRKGWRLAVKRVETVELPALSYFYVSKLPPEAVGLDRRVSRGHTPPLGTLCAAPPPPGTPPENGDLTWRDLIDFYARHRCESYRAPEGYRAFSRPGERPLPVMSSG